MDPFASGCDAQTSTFQGVLPGPGENFERSRNNGEVFEKFWDVLDS